jgi:hypothetical protein
MYAPQVSLSLPAECEISNRAISTLTFARARCENHFSQEAPTSSNNGKMHFYRLKASAPNLFLK